MASMWYTGIDISNTTFTASTLETLENPFFLGEFPNHDDGFQTFLQQLSPAQIDGVFLMEATGVYSEALSDCLFQRNVLVHVEPPHQVKKAFYERGKTDPIDSRQIAEYGFRFPDRLHPWKPREDILEQLRVLMTIRYQYTGIKTKIKNARKSLERKRQPYPTALALHLQMLQALKTVGSLIDKEMKAIIKQNIRLAQTMQHLETIPGVGFWMAVNFCLLTDGFTTHLHPKHLASYIGICPFPYESGTSVKRPPHADSAGPARLRSLLYLASMTMSKNNPQMKAYFDRKVREGKSKRLVMNNIANKLLRVMCAIVERGKPYDEKFLSFNPTLF